MAAQSIGRIGKRAVHAIGVSERGAGMSRPADEEHLTGDAHQRAFGRSAVDQPEIGRSASTAP